MLRSVESEQKTIAGGSRKGGEVIKTTISSQKQRKTKGERSKEKPDARLA